MRNTIIVNKMPIELCKVIPQHRAGAVVGNTSQWLISNFNREYLEENNVYCFLFDTTKNFKCIEEYSKVLTHFKGSDRIFSHSFLIGDYPTDLQGSIVARALRFYSQDGYWANREERYEHK